MRKSLITAVMAIATLSSSFAAAQPQYGQHARHGQQGQAPQGFQQNGGCYQGERADDCSQRLSAQQRTHHQYVWRNGHYEDRTASGATAAAGIIGFLMGMAIAGSNSDRDYYNAHRNDRNWQSRCRATYSSFDYRTGTYIGRDGYRHYCTR